MPVLIGAVITVVLLTVSVLLALTNKINAITFIIILDILVSSYAIFLIVYVTMY